MKDINYNLKPNELTFGDQINQVLRSVHENFQEIKTYNDEQKFLTFELVSELPSTIEEGVMLFYNGTIWKGLAAGESSLPVGTPWPVKGYKELKFALRQDNSDDPVSWVLIDDFELGILGTREGVGAYSFDILDIYDETPPIYWELNISNQIKDEWEGAQRFVSGIMEVVPSYVDTGSGLPVDKVGLLRIFTYYMDGLSEGGMADSILTDMAGCVVSIKQYTPKLSHPGLFPPNSNILPVE